MFKRLIKPFCIVWRGVFHWQTRFVEPCPQAQIAASALENSAVETGTILANISVAVPRDLDRDATEEIQRIVDCG